ncbi:hypothetical protein [Candidatus Mycoplasma mahonii]|uniref:hypothetical protein n=1 Tax=Candidatus Mycoplasma mahonii TaxID=3004105 RepID=UPI0026ECC1C6|nr:hypothetical protein [Candidatus Mycoplasma mahonii]WKX02414.1 hypothetical protein O3I44_03405 [Candidatus Mycoplasma mahonii]
MLLNTLLTIIIIPIIITSMFLIGSYVSKSQDIFKGNDFASFVLGSIIYFIITFAIFIPFLWTINNELYYIIIFFIKEAFLYLILGLKWEKGTLTTAQAKKLIMVVFVGVLITIIYNYGVVKAIGTHNEITPKYFETWHKFKMVMTRFLVLGTDYSSNWFFPILVSSIGYASVASFISEFYRMKNYLIIISSFVSTLLVTLFFSIGLNLSEMLGIFLILFVIASAVRLINLSRRRYGVVFGLSIIGIFSIQSSLIAVLFMIALSTMITYTFLKKPKNSLFLVQLFAPILIVESLTLYGYSKILSITIFVLTISAYVFMVSIGRAKLMNRINTFLEMTRIYTPIIIFLTIFSAAISVFFVNAYDSSIFTIYESFVYTRFTNSFIEYMFQLTIYYSSIVVLIGFLIHSYIKKKKLSNYILLILFVLIITIIVYNPITNILFEELNYQEEFSLMKTSVFMPIFALAPLLIIKIAKKITYHIRH